jgi:hypothetical protein
LDRKEVSAKNSKGGGRRSGSGQPTRWNVNASRSILIRIRSRKEGNVRERMAEDVDDRDNNFDRTKFPIIMHRDNLEISSIYSSSFTTP